MPEQNAFELRWIFTFFRRWWWLMIACALIAGLAAYFLSSLAEPKFNATVTLMIEPARSTNTSEYNLIIAAERQALTYSEMIKSYVILEKVTEELDLEQTVEDLSKRVAVKTMSNTQLIQVTVEESSADQAAKLANTIAEVFTAHIRSLLSTRYTNSLVNMQGRIDLLDSAIVDAQEQIDALNAKRIESQAEKNRLEELLNEYRVEFRSLENDYQDLQLTVSQIADQVTVIESASVPDDTRYAPFVATVKLLVKPISGITGTSYSAQTYGQMLISRPVVESAISQLDLNESSDAIVKRLEVEIIPDTQVLQLDVSDNLREEAVSIAGAITSVFLEQVQALAEKPFANRLATIETDMDSLSETIDRTEQQIETLNATQVQAETDIDRLQDLLLRDRSDSRALQQDYDDLRLVADDAAESVIISDLAQVPVEPESPKPLRNAVIDAIAGAMLAAGIAFLLDYLDDTIKNPQDIHQKLGLSTIGSIGVLTNGERKLVVEEQPRSPAAEAFRVLATNIRYASLDKPLKKLLVTSPLPKEGKTLVASNLAVAISHTERNVVVVDADLRLPRLHQIFGIDQDQGLSESILEGSVKGNLRTLRKEQLSILTSGEVPPNPTEVVNSQRMIRILEELSEDAQIVIIDSSPILLAADAKALATQVDGVLLVLRVGQTTTQAAREAVESLRQVNANILGAVLNAEPGKKDGYHYYQYHEGSKKESSNIWKKIKGTQVKVPHLNLKRLFSKK